jgi:Protein-glutamine gamma-glutamyltransferase
MENMREYWAREAEMMRDKSAILGERTDVSGTFQANVVNAAKRIFDKKVVFGLNSVRNKAKLFDTKYWVAKGESQLAMIEGVLPAKALLSIIDNTSGKQTLDCAQFVQVAYLGGILLTDGETKFNKDIGKQFVLSSFGSTGVKTETLYSRGLVNEKFSINDSLTNLTDTKQEALVSAAPIGSRVTVENFLIQPLAAGEDKAKKEFALGIRARGWERENMIKIGEDKYAAFGVGYGVDMKTVQKGLLDEYYGRGRYNAQQADALLKWIGISQVEYFKRK